MMWAHVYDYIRGFKGTDFHTIQRTMDPLKKTKARERDQKLALAEPRQHPFTRGLHAVLGSFLPERGFSIIISKVWK